MPTSITTQTTSVSPTIPGTYVYQVLASDGVCSTTSTVSVILSNVPSIVASATPTTVCSGSSVNLNAVNGAPGMVTSGTNTTTTSSTGYPTAFGNYWYQTWQQYLFTAAELNAMGLTAGNITSLAFSIAVVPNPITPLADYNIQIATTTNTALSAFTTAGLTNVFGPASVTAATGLNTINLSTPYNWDGVSNLIIDLRQTEFYGNGNANTYYTTTSNNSVLYSYATTSNASYWTSSPAPTTSTSRPNITFGGVVSQSQPVTWQWNPGAINSNTASVNPVNTGTTPSTMVYTVTSTNTITTCSNTATVSVLVNPLPSTPVVSNSSQCGLGVPSASVSGGTSYNWYASPTSTTVLQAGTISHYTTSINSTTTWYVSSYNGTCESVRAAVTASVTIPDVVTASSTSTMICPGGSYTLTATKVGSTNNYNYTWTATPAAGSGIPTSVSGATAAVTPSTAGTYAYLVTAVDGICTTTASINVTLNNPPTINSSATPTMVCSGSTVNLNANFVSAGAATVGSGTSTTSSTGYPTAFGNYWYQTWQQYLFTAAELHAMGLAAGNITSLAFSVSAVPNPNTPLADYNIQIATTTNTALSAFTTAGLTNVFGPATVTAATGLNTINLSTPYNWDGLSNLIIDLRQTEFYGNGNATTYYTTTSNNSVLYSYATTSNASYWTSSPAPTTSTSRPNITFGGQITQSGPVTFQWNPGAINSNTASVNPVNTGTTASTMIYTVTATNTITTCSNTATVAVLVNPIPVTPTVFNSVQCGVAIPTASVSGGTSYNWYASPTSTTVLQAGTSATFTSSISNTTSYYVSSFNGNCESPRAMVTASVSIPDAVSASASSATICPSTSATLTAVHTGTANNYSYTWTATPVAGSGISTSISGTTAVVSPTTAGTYAYLLTAVDGICTATASINVTLSSPPAISASATPSMVCASGTVTLDAESIPATAGTGTVGVEATTGITAGPYRQGAGTDNKAQYLFTAADLTAAGFAQGNITGLSFNVTSNGIGTMNNFTIKMGNTNSTSYTTTYDVAPAAVFGPVAYTTITGLNTHTFTTPFYWNGTSNVVIEVCHDVVSGGSSSSISQDAIPNSVIYSNTTGACALTTGNSSANRPVIVFAGQVGTNMTSSMNFVWNPGAITTNTAVVSLVNTGTTSITQTYTATVTNTLTGCTNFTTVSVVLNPIPVVSATTASSLICANYTTTLTATGANTYTWLPVGGNSVTAVVTPSTNTTYTVIGDLAGCTASTTVSIATNPSPTLSVVSSATSAICAGTSATLTTSGTATSFTWTPAVSTTSAAVINPLGNTTYTVVGFNAGCTTTRTISVAVLGNPLISIAATNTVICVGATTSSTLTAAGATSYTWAPNTSTTAVTVVSPTTATIYTVTGSASGCTATRTININVANVPTVTAVGPAGSVCSSSTATLNAAGSAASYTWLPVGGNTITAVVTPTTTTTYTLIGSNAGCTNSSNVTVTVTSLPSVTALSSKTVICKGENAVLTASTSATSYTWSNGVNTVSTTVTPSVSTNYTVSVSNGTCTASASVSVTVSPCIGIEELLGANGISIYPNPTIDKLNIAINTDLVNTTSIAIYDAIGKLVMTEKLTSELTSIRTSNLDSGVYFVKVISNNKEIRIEKLIKQ